MAGCQVTVIKPSLPAKSLGGTTKNIVGIIYGAVTIPGAIFNSHFDRLAYCISEASVTAELVGGQSYEHAAESFIGLLLNPLRDEVVGVYTDSLKSIWQASSTWTCCIGLLVVFSLKQIELRKTLETDYGMTRKVIKEEQNNTDRFCVAQF
jgi:hypothetical protein